MTHIGSEAIHHEIQVHTLDQAQTGLEITNKMQEQVAQIPRHLPL